MRISPFVALLAILTALGFVAWHYHGLLLLVALRTALAATAFFAAWALFVSAKTVLTWAWKRPIGGYPKPEIDKAEAE